MLTGGTIRRLLLLVAAGVLFFSVGCVSERERQLREYRRMHRTIRETDGAMPGEWELKEKTP